MPVIADRSSALRELSVGLASPLAATAQRALLVRFGAQVQEVLRESSARVIVR